MKTKILQELLNSDIKIKSQEKLEQYIEYCIGKNKCKRILKDGYSKVSYHHILPKSIFEHYSDLKKHTWNGTYLLYADHYYAHWLLTEAIEDCRMLFAFCAMHQQDIRNGRIQEKDLIARDEFQLKMEENNKRDRTEALMKCRETHKQHPEIRKNTNIKHSKTISSKEWKETIGKEANAKHSKTRNSKEWKETKGKEAIKKFKISFKKTFDKEAHDERTLKRSKFKNFEIYNAQDVMIHKSKGLLTEYCRKNNLPLQALKKSSKNNGIYKTKAGLRNAKLKGFEKYQGYYIKFL